MREKGGNLKKESLLTTLSRSYFVFTLMSSWVIFLLENLVTQSFSSCFSQGAFDYCANLGGILPSPDFFDIYNIGEAPRTSSFMPNDTSVSASEAAETASENSASAEQLDDEFVDTSIDFVDQNGIEKSIRKDEPTKNR